MDRAELGAPRLAELDHFAAACRTRPELPGMVQTLFDAIFPHTARRLRQPRNARTTCSTRYGFDRAMHEQIREDLKAGRIGLAQNRLPANSVIEDVRESDLTDATALAADAPRTRPRRAAERRGGRGHAGRRRRLALDPGRGRGQGAASVLQARRPPPLVRGNPPRQEPAESRGSAALPCPTSSPPATSRTSRPARFLEQHDNFGYEGPLVLSDGKSIGLRMVPTVRDLRFAWEEMPQQTLDDQQQKVRDSLRAALIGWAQSAGEAVRLHRQPAAAMPAPGRPLV